MGKTFGCVRLVYNHYLDRKKQLWEESKQSMSYNACAKDLTSLKKEKEFLKEVDSIRTFSNEKKAAIPGSKAESGESSLTPQ